MKNEMNPIQKRLSRMMGDFHTFLEENKIPYFLWAGTLLGAIRHEGFIPWDDDLDIAMLREDFERLLAISDKIPAPYKLRCIGLPGTHENYPYFYAKLEDTNTVLTENHIRHLGIKSGLYIDVFVMDTLPDHPVRRKIHTLNIRFWMAIRRFLLVDPSKPRSIVKQIPVTVVQKLFCLPKVIRKLNRVAKKYESSRGLTVTNWSGMYDKVPPVYEISKLEGGGLCQYGEYQFRSVKDAHHILTQIYGDYMQLPPVERRVGNHDYTLEILE